MSRPQSIELISTSLGDFVRTAALAVAEAQAGLDTSSIQVAEMMAGSRVVRDADGQPILSEDGTSAQLMDSRVYFGFDADPSGRRVPSRVSMLELGFTPTFYQFVETVIEVRLAMRMTGAGTDGSGPGISVTPVDASYSSSYGYDAKLACVFRTKLVPIPPPVLLEDRIRAMNERDAERKAAASAPVAPPSLPAVGPSSTADEPPE